MDLPPVMTSVGTNTDSSSSNCSSRRSDPLLLPASNTVDTLLSSSANEWPQHNIPFTSTYATDWNAWQPMSTQTPSTVVVSSSQRPLLPPINTNGPPINAAHLLRPPFIPPYNTPDTPNPNIRSRTNTMMYNDATLASDLVEMQLSKHKLKATSRTSALLAGFAMVALVELDYASDTPHGLIIVFSVCTTLLVSVHLLALMMSTCMLPHLEALGSSANPSTSPHHQLRWYIELSWFFSTCLGLILFLLEIGVIFWIKFLHIKYTLAAKVSTGILIPVFVVFLLFTYKFYRKLMIHHVDTLHNKLEDMRRRFDLEDGQQMPLRVV